MIILAVDGDSVFRRNWEAPGGSTGSTALNRTVAAIERESNGYDRTVVAWDAKSPSFRATRCPWYKASRIDPGTACREWAARTMTELANRGYVNIVAPTVTVDGFAGAAEADDVIAWVAAEYSCLAHDEWHLRIMSSDGDLEALVSAALRIDQLKSWGTPRVILTEKTIVEKRGVEPKQIPELKALMGDEGEVRGFLGIGGKCAAMLVRTFDTALDAVAKAPDDQSIEPKFLNAAQRASLREHGAERALEGLWLATLRPNLPLDFGVVTEGKPTAPSEPDESYPLEPETPEQFEAQNDTAPYADAPPWAKDLNLKLDTVLRLLQGARIS